MRHCFLFLLFAVVSGCQWVNPASGADQVSLVKPAHVINCKKLGTTTSTVKAKIGFVERKEQKVTEELVTLAKNEAAKLGADSIIALDEATNNSQTFAIFSCQ